MQPVQYMHPDGRCEDLLEYTERMGFCAPMAQTDEDGMDAIDNALDWLNGACDGVRFIIAEFGVVVKIPA
jgi:hypothetical protein